MPALTSALATGRFRVGLRRLFYGHRPAAVAFQAGLLALDIAALAYFLATTFVATRPGYARSTWRSAPCSRSSSWAGCSPTATRCTTSTTARRCSTSS
jgi:hypothetical protein